MSTIGIPEPLNATKKVGFTIDPDVRKEAKIDDETWISINMKIDKTTFELQEA